jgi:hypothetical protein
MKSIHTLTAAAVITAFASVVSISTATAQIASSDPSVTPTVSVTVNGATTPITLTSTSVSGVWTIALGQAVQDEPSGSLVIPVPVAGDPYLSYGFSETNTSSTAQTYTLTYSLDAVIPPGPTQVNSSLSVSLTNGQPQGTYSISPAAGNTYLQYSYLGTMANPKQTDAGVNLGNGFFFTNPPSPNSGSENFSAPTQPGPNGPYTKLTIYTSFILPAGDTASGNGSFDVTSVPEPTTCVLLFFSLAILFVAPAHRALRKLYARFD